MRSAELARAMELLPPRGHILELGAGDGWQASMLAQHGFTVSAVDVARPAPGTTQYAPVAIYDGTTLPFADGTFDAVFSSNVLEHVKDFDRTQAELARVLNPRGLAVHCVPTAVWRFWTTAGHPLYALRWIMRSRQQAGRVADKPDTQSGADRPSRISPLAKLRLGIVAPRHGEHGTILSEHYLFSRRSWVRRFQTAGWQVVATRPTGLFYSGNELLGDHIATRLRRQAARLLGSSTAIFVLRFPPRNPAKEP
jgi:SAM-dependent methyltransferase